jgi:hypothetical protein
MKYSDIVEILYGNDSDSIISLLNESVFAKNYNPIDNYSVISTGFCCKIQTGRFFEFLYDMSNETMIRQPKPLQMLPLLNGLIFGKDKELYKGFFYGYYQIIITGVQSDNNDFVTTAQPLYQTVCSTDFDLETVEILKDENKDTYKNFVVFDKDSKVLNKIPLQRVFMKLFFGKNRFDYLNSY